MLGIVFRGSSPGTGHPAPFGDAGHEEPSPGTGHDAPDSLQAVRHHVPRTVTRVLGSRDLPWGQDIVYFIRYRAAGTFLRDRASFPGDHPQGGEVRGPSLGTCPLPGVPRDITSAGGAILGTLPGDGTRCTRCPAACRAPRSFAGSHTRDVGPLQHPPGSPWARGPRRQKIHRASVSFCFLVVIEDDRIDDVLQNLSEKAPPGV